MITTLNVSSTILYILHRLEIQHATVVDDFKPLVREGDTLLDTNLNGKNSFH